MFNVLIKVGFFIFLKYKELFLICSKDDLELEDFVTTKEDKKKKKIKEPIIVR